MLVGYCFPVLSIYFGSINIALNIKGKWGVINYEWVGWREGGWCLQANNFKQINKYFYDWREQSKFVG